MNHAEFAKTIIATIQEAPANIPPIANEETRQNNAARCMSQLICNRLSSNGTFPSRANFCFIRRTQFTAEKTFEHPSYARTNPGGPGAGPRFWTIETLTYKKVVSLSLTHSAKSIK